MLSSQIFYLRVLRFRYQNILRNIYFLCDVLTHGRRFTFRFSLCLVSCCFCLLSASKLVYCSLTKLVYFYASIIITECSVIQFHNKRFLYRTCTGHAVTAVHSAAFLLYSYRTTVRQCRRFWCFFKFLYRRSTILRELRSKNRSSVFFVVQNNSLQQ